MPAPTDALLDPRCRGAFVVTGGSGTGKTSLLVDVAATRIAAGARPESVLVLTGSAQASAGLRDRLSAAVFAQSSTTVVREPMVRTVHSYAFAVLAARAAGQGNPPPRLITAAEQDSIVRELLSGQSQDGTGSWPQALRPALTTAGFATAVRDMMARCAERGVDPAALRALGRRHRRPEWVAVAELARQYEEVMLLRSAVGMAAPQATVPALGAAELVGSALEAFAVDPEILAAERLRIDTLLVDDAQHFDPQAAQLVRLLAAGAGLSVVAGDANQLVFAFRGADAQLLTDGCTHIELSQSYRCAAPVAELVNTIATRLPGAAPARSIVGTGEPHARVQLALARSEAAEATMVAELLRRAHLFDGVPWSQMAVIVRSVPRSGPVLRRVLQSAGVPVHAESYDGPLAAVPAVHALLLAVSAAHGQLDADDAVTLLTGPIGRVDPVALRRLRRTLLRVEESAGGDRRSGDLLRDAVLSGPDASLGLTDIQAAPVRRVGAVIAAARESARSGTNAVDVLWAAWTRSGLQRRWDALSQRGGPLGVQADRDLAAVAALFDLTSEHVARTPGIGVMGLIDHVRSLALPGGRRSVTEPDAVTVISAHAAAGRQWDVVAIPGVQEGLWPNLSVRGGVLRAQELMDVLAGIDDVAHVSAQAVTLAEERRLFLVAAGRARCHVLISSVDNEDTDTGSGPAMPSRFLTELIAAHPEWLAGEPVSGSMDTPSVTAATLVGQLRAVVTAPADAVSTARRHSAARQLARLAAAGIPGANPDTWYGVGQASTAEPLWHSDDGPVQLSPSTVEMLTTCPLRWLLERHGGADQTDPSRVLGTLVHTLVGDHCESPHAMQRELENAWQQISFESHWYARNELRRHHELLDNFVAWYQGTRGELTEVGREIEVDGVLDEPGHPPVRLAGRIDRLERDSAGRPVVVDIKTGKTPATKDEAQQHAQLAAYQVAAAEGFIPEAGAAAEPGGGRLVYVAKSHVDDGSTQRHQDPLTPAAQQDWRELIHQAAAATQGPLFLARVNDGCGHCPVRACCPAQPEGQGVCQ